jgi:hypothetical protein
MLAISDIQVFDKDSHLCISFDFDFNGFEGNLVVPECEMEMVKYMKQSIEDDTEFVFETGNIGKCEILQRKAGGRYYLNFGDYDSCIEIPINLDNDLLKIITHIEDTT